MVGAVREPPLRILPSRGGPVCPPWELREAYFPLTPTLSPIGGEGEKLNQYNVLWLLNPVT